ncbi:MAG: universal stress protein [Acidobacteriia bacterium]|nr:universal stress protein [Terriglobia bacterium]
MPTFQPKQILCPTDFSEHSAAALRAAGGIARAFDAKVMVLHAQRLEAPVYFTKAQTQALRVQLRRGARAARDFVSKFATQYLPENVEHSVLLVEEDPVRAVLEELKRTRAGLLVMGTHGRTGLARIRLGSVTESVLRQVNVPVLTVGPQIKPTAALGTIRRVLCPVNYSDLAQTAFEHAAALAVKTGAELVLTHVLESEAHGNEAQALQELCDWVAPEVRQRCTVREVVKQGSPAEQIVAEAKNSRADVVVVGAHPRSFLGTVLFGSTTELVIRNAPCPVLSVIRK